VRGEMVLVGNPDAAEVDSPTFCPDIFLTDEADQNYSNGPFQGGDPAETFIKHTDPVVVDADEVWFKIETTSCHPNWRGGGVSEFDVEIQLTVLD